MRIEAGAMVPAGAAAPASSGVYRPPDEARARAVVWRRREASPPVMREEGAALRRDFVVAVCPPALGPPGPYPPTLRPGSGPKARAAPSGRTGAEPVARPPDRPARPQVGMRGRWGRVSRAGDRSNRTIRVTLSGRSVAWSARTGARPSRRP